MSRITRNPYSECAKHFPLNEVQWSTQIVYKVFLYLYQIKLCHCSRKGISVSVQPSNIPCLTYSLAFAWQNYLPNIICKNLMNICLLLFFKRLARGLISHWGRHSFVTLLVTLAVTLCNQGRLWPERSRQDPTSSVCAKIFVAHSKSSCTSWGTKTRHTHTQTHTQAHRHMHNENKS